MVYKNRCKNCLTYKFLLNIYYLHLSGPCMVFSHFCKCVKKKLTIFALLTVYFFVHITVNLCYFWYRLYKSVFYLSKLP